MTSNNNLVSDFMTLFFSKNNIFEFLYRNSNNQNAKLFLAFVSVLGLLLIAAVPLRSAAGQLTKHFGDDMSTAKITPTAFIECGKQELGQPCGPNSGSFFIPNNLAINAGCRADDYDITEHLALAGVGVLTLSPFLPPEAVSPFLLQNILTDKILSHLRTVNPEWVNVQGDGGQVIAQGTVVSSAVSHDDFPTDHYSHDQNFDVKLDPKYQPYNSDANYGLPESLRIGKHLYNYQKMGMEWEINDFPKEFWPSAGDRVWMKGPLIWDCGHAPYQTEIHPPTAVVFSHTGATFFNSNSKSLRVTPCTLFNTVCNDNIPSLATIAHIFISGHGGYLNTPVGGEHYLFDIPLPPKPSQYAQPYVEVQSKSFDAITIATSPTFVVDEAKQVVHVDYDLTSKSPSPDLRFGIVVAAGWKEPVLSQNYHLLRVTIDSIQINKYHSPACDSFPCNAGEWPFWINVGGTWIDLDRVNSGVFSKPQSVQVLVPENGKLTIQTTGWNTNKGDYKLGLVKGDENAILQALIERYFGTSSVFYAEVKLIGGLDLAHLRPDKIGKAFTDAVTFLLDGFKIGIVSQSYDSTNNFGIGTDWNPTSTINVEDPPNLPLPQSVIDTVGDFNLGYHIKEDILYSKGSLGYKDLTKINCTQNPGCINPPPGPRVHNFPGS